ncbi:MAG: AAA family ATPase [Acidimicrobiia bacterium]|nr:AAA family ATPase [Acidimicrobiia bacterium]
MTAETQRLEGRHRAVLDKAEQLAGEAARLRGELGDCEQTELPLVESMEDAEARRADAESALAAAEDRRRSAESDAHAAEARVEALALALDEARSRAGAERLSAVDGVLGTLLDLVATDEGYEAAFEAAAGEALSSVVVASEAAGRQALATLAAEELSGSVLALYHRGETPALPVEGRALRSHVRSTRPEVEALLDVLIGGVAVVDDLDEAVDLALARPAATVVTVAGDRFAPGGWRLGAAGAGVTGAALDTARQRASDARAAVERAASAHADARSALEEARRAEAEVSRRLDDNDGRMAAAADGLQRVESERRDALTEAEALAAHLAETAERRERDLGRVAELEAELPRLEAAEADLAERGRRMAEDREAIEQQARQVGNQRADLDVRSAGLTERRSFLATRLEATEERLARTAAERDAASARREELDRRGIALDRLATVVTERHAVVNERLEDLRARRRRQSEAARAVAEELDQTRRRRSSVEKELLAVREKLQRTELDDAEIKLRIETATETLRRDHDCEPATAMAAEAPPLAEGTTAVARARELERDLRLMGPINPLALEEFEALNERHEFLQAQLDDVKQTRRELGKVIRAIDEEIVSVFAAAFADVAANFEHLFGTLFPGGVGRLRLTQPDDLLATGIEVEAKPSGKNVKKLSLLSGGERSLTALAFLFAIFRSRPSPFYVMDEVEAALDDVNLHRFLELVAEFRNDAQLVIVSHQKRTMEAADCLYGVTMQPGGSSKAVSEKVGAGS